MNTDSISLDGYIDINEVIKCHLDNNPKVLLRHSDPKFIFDVKTRCEFYDIYKYLKKDFNILDVGCSKGLFGFHLHTYCKKYLGIDFNEKNIEIANSFKKRDNIDNCEFICKDFVSFCKNNQEKVDFILFLAVEKWIRQASNISHTEVINLIYELVSKNGYILFETHPLSNNEYIISWENMILIIQNKFEIIYRKESKEKREILLLKKI